MDSDGELIKDTILWITDRTGHTFTLVTFAGGRCGVARDGKPIDAYFWTGGQMKGCVAALVQLAGLDRID